MSVRLFSEADVRSILSGVLLRFEPEHTTEDLVDETLRTSIEELEALELHRCRREGVPWFFISSAWGLYVQGTASEDAVRRAHVLGIHPGGDNFVVSGPLASDVIAGIPLVMRERLLGRDELEEWGVW